MVDRLTIARLGRRGDGIADTPDGPVFVPVHAAGRNRGSRGLARPPRPPAADQDRRSASAERIAPICPHFGTCGGCALQHWTAARYRDWKRGLVIEALSQAGLDAPVDDLIDAHGEGRRRAVLHARRSQSDVLEVGFAAPRAHQIVAIDRCPVLAPALDGAIAAAWAIAEAVETMRKPLDIQVTATEDGLDVDVRGSGPLTTAATTALARVAAQHRLARLTRHGEIVAQRAAPTITIGRARVALPPGAFLQATAAGEAALAGLVLEHCGKAAGLPTCSRASDRSRCGLPNARASPPPTATRQRSPRSSAPPRRRRA